VMRAVKRDFRINLKYVEIRSESILAGLEDRLFALPSR
jgi:hypothetical protein